MRLATVATCSLNQWALDFGGNAMRIRASIEEAKRRGARFRVGPELEIPGYGCEDAFLEADTEHHAWEVLAALLEDDLTDGILCDVGLPVTHDGVRYNARAFVLDRRVHLLRPKMALADDGAYRESRWFAAWRRPRQVEAFRLPAAIRERTGQERVPIGDAALATGDTVLASESCEELFTPDAPHVGLGLAGVEVFANGSASHHQLRKLQRRLERIRAATIASGGIYLYANARGCDGGRFGYDGGAMIVANGEVLAQGAQFSPREVEVVTARVDLDAVRAHRAAQPSRMRQAAGTAPVPRIEVGIDLGDGRDAPAPTRPRALTTHAPEEEIALGPACWLWDHLRRSGASGFFLALSGGADSAAVAGLVASLGRMLADEVAAGTPEVVTELRRVLRLREDEPLPGEARALVGALLTTAYLPSDHSSTEGARRAHEVAAQVGARHLEAGIDGPVEAFLRALHESAGVQPRFAADGGAPHEDAALQNLQARSRMVMSYLLAQALPGPGGPRLVLGTSNVDETLVGYVTKYDTSAADLAPIGGISKHDLRRFLAWAAEAWELPVLAEVAGATPTAELRPPRDGVAQRDEADLGLTYAELARFGELRKVHGCGPLSAFERLLREWDHLSPAEVEAKVRRFYGAHAATRHKAVVLTPAYHAEAYDPDDHRFDPRPFLQPADWPWQFRAIARRRAELADSCAGEED